MKSWFYNYVDFLKVSIEANIPSRCPAPGEASGFHHSARWSWQPVPQPWSAIRTLKAQPQHRFAETWSFPLQPLTQRPFAQFSPLVICFIFRFSVLRTKRKSRQVVSFHHQRTKIQSFISFHLWAGTSLPDGRCPSKLRS